MARDPAFFTRTTAATALVDIVPVPAPSDALSNPSNDDLLGAALTFWPPGAAWGSPDGEAISLSSLIARFTRVLVSQFETLYARAFSLARESSVSGVNELLAEWEVEYGLPDSCLSGEATRSERLRALEAKVASAAVITPGDFIRVAANYGFEITITEPAMFECGFSECGGEHEIGPASEETYWFVSVTDLAIDYFRVGESECGFDPLFSIGEAEFLLCILRRLAPAWTLPVLLYDETVPDEDMPLMLGSPSMMIGG
jgi:uncharacterized protein YmfQ (DUF2313 family)